MKGISIIICCYNSSSRIEETLRYIFNLTTVDKIQYEVLLVNNNSNDNTLEVASQIERLHNKKCFPFRTIDEPKPGLSLARMAGVNAAQFEIICFCDDDNHLSEDYFAKAARILESHPSIGILGGIALPKFSVSPGGWIKSFYGAMAIGPQSTEDGFVQWLYGAGMIIKKEVFTALKSRKIELLLSDRKGEILTSGGDAEICSIALFMGYKIYYSSTMILFHAIPAYRLQKKHYLKARLSTIYPSAYLFILDHVIHNRETRWFHLYLKNVINSINNLLYSLPRIVFGSHNFYNLFVTYRTFQMLTWLLIHRNRFRTMYNSVIANLKITN